jgi:hypothetical protein
LILSLGFLFLKAHRAPNKGGYTVTHNLTLQGMREAKLTTSERLVFLLLRDQTSGRQRTESGIEVLPNQVLSSERSVAEACDFSKATARRALQRLHDFGWISVCRMGQKGTLYIIRKYRTFEPLKRTAQTLQNQSVSCESYCQSEPLLARGVTAVTAVSPGVGVAVVSPVVLIKDNSAAKTNFAAPRLSASGGGNGPEREPVPNWSRLTEHIMATWKRKFPDGRFKAAKSDWHAVKQIGRTYPAHEIALGWNDALKSDNRFLRESGYSLRAFASLFQGFAIRRGFRQEALKILDVWEGPPSNTAVDKLLGMIGDKSLVSALTDLPQKPAKTNPQPEETYEAIPKNFLWNMVQQHRQQSRNEKGKTSHENQNP